MNKFRNTKLIKNKGLKIYDISGYRVSTREVYVETSERTIVRKFTVDIWLLKRLDLEKRTWSPKVHVEE